MIRLLWQGGNRSHHGRYDTVENARLYHAARHAAAAAVAVGGQQGAEQAARLGDGMIGTTPERALLTAFDRAVGSRARRPERLAIFLLVHQFHGGSAGSFQSR